jgi:hypothetical protein
MPVSIDSFLRAMLDLSKRWIRRTRKTRRAQVKALQEMAIVNPAELAPQEVPQMPPANLMAMTPARWATYPAPRLGLSPHLANCCCEAIGLKSARLSMQPAIKWASSESKYSLRKACTRDAS